MKQKPRQAAGVARDLEPRLQRAMLVVIVAPTSSRSITQRTFLLQTHTTDGRCYFNVQSIAGLVSRE